LGTFSQLGATNCHQRVDSLGKKKKKDAAEREESPQSGKIITNWKTCDEFPVLPLTPLCLEAMQRMSLQCLLSLSSSSSPHSHVVSLSGLVIRRNRIKSERS